VEGDFRGFGGSLLLRDSSCSSWWGAEGFFWTDTDCSSVEREGKKKKYRRKELRRESWDPFQFGVGQMPAGNRGGEMTTNAVEGKKGRRVSESDGEEKICASGSRKKLQSARSVDFL